MTNLCPQCGYDLAKGASHLCIPDDDTPAPAPSRDTAGCSPEIDLSTPAKEPIADGMDGVELCPHYLVKGDPSCMYCPPPTSRSDYVRDLGADLSAEPDKPAILPGSTPAAREVREFTLHFDENADNPKVRVESKLIKIKFNEVVHVIEKSAYDALKAERDSARAMVEDFRKNATATELTRLRRELERLKAQIADANDEKRFE